MVARNWQKDKPMFVERLTPERLCGYMDREHMYVTQVRPEIPETQERGRRGHLTDTWVWRGRWLVASLVAVVLLGVGYGREAVGSALPGAAVPAASQTVTVTPGDTLWTIASRRYPDADVRQKVFEIEQLNGLSGPTILAGQHLRVPVH
jgi:LysM domain